MEATVSEAGTCVNAIVSPMSYTRSTNVQPKSRRAGDHEHAGHVRVRGRAGPPFAPGRNCSRHGLRGGPLRIALSGRHGEWVAPGMTHLHAHVQAGREARRQAG